MFPTCNCKRVVLSVIVYFVCLRLIRHFLGLIELDALLNLGITFDQIEAVRVLDMVFSIFDVFTQENGAYKVETVGCTYLAACGKEPMTLDLCAWILFE